MNQLKFVARLKIHADKLEQFNNIAKECLKTVREKDQGTLQYDWYLNKEQTECVVLEGYEDSNALLAHMGNLGDTLGQLLSLSDFTGEFYGNPSQELMKAVEGFEIAYYGEWQKL